MYLGNTTIAGTLSQQGATPAASIATTGGVTTLTPAQYGAAAIIVTGTLTSGATLVMPNSGGWLVSNRTTGSFPVLVTTAAGLGVAVPRGGALSLTADGTNVVPVGGTNPAGFAPSGAAALGGSIPMIYGRCLNEGAGFTADIAGPGTSQIAFTPTMAMTSIRALYQNYTFANYLGEGDNPNPITVSAALWDGTTAYSMQFGGQPSVTLGKRGECWSDPLGMLLPDPAAFTGSISGTTLTVTAMLNNSKIVQNAAVRGVGVIALQYVVGQLTGTTGGVGTYQLNHSQTLASTTMFAGAFYWLRTLVRIAVAPTTPVAAGSASGGTLAAATYYYKITAVCGAQGESGGSAEVSYAASGSTSSVALTWGVDQRSVAPVSFNIYRGTATGAESFLCNVGLPPVNAAGQYAWTDTGAIANGVNAQASAAAMSASTSMNLTATALGNPAVGMYVFGTGITAGAKVTAIGTYGGNNGTLTLSAAQTISAETVTFANPVPAQQTYPLGSTAGAAPNEGCNGTAYGGPSSDQTLATNNNWMYGYNQQLYTAVEVAGVPAAQVARPVVVGIVADSVEAGQNSSGGGTNDRGVIAQALAALNIPYRNMAKAGDLITYQATPTYFRSRGQLLGGCTHIIIQSSANDITSGLTQAVVETALMSLATLCAASGAKVFVTTVTPHTTTTDNGITVSNQTVRASESVRVAENNWRRAGCPINPTTLQPVAIGTGGALLMGQSGHPIFGVVDQAGAVEVNASNVLTTNGGFYAVLPIGSTPPGTPCSEDGTHPTSFSTQTITGSISGTTLTVTASSPFIGAFLTGTGITAGTLILSGSGSTWTVNISQTVASTTITCTPAGNGQVVLGGAVTAGLFV